MTCHVQAYLHMYDVTRGLQKNGQFLLNTIFDADEFKKFMPDTVKHYFALNNITFYTINATKIAQEIGLGNCTNTILQSALLHPFQDCHMGRDAVRDAFPEQPRKLHDLGHLMRAYAGKGIEHDCIADGYLFVSVSGNSNSVTSLSFSVSDERINFRCFFCSLC